VKQLLIAAGLAAVTAACVPVGSPGYIPSVGVVSPVYGYGYGYYRPYGYGYSYYYRPSYRRYGYGYYHRPYRAGYYGGARVYRR